MGIKKNPGSKRAPVDVNDLLFSGHGIFIEVFSFCIRPRASGQLIAGAAHIFRIEKNLPVEFGFLIWKKLVFVGEIKIAVPDIGTQEGLPVSAESENSRTQKTGSRTEIRCLPVGCEHQFFQRRDLFCGFPFQIGTEEIIFLIVGISPLFQQGTDR